LEGDSKGKGKEPETRYWNDQGPGSTGNRINGGGSDFNSSSGSIQSNSNLEVQDNNDPISNKYIGIETNITTEGYLFKNNTILDTLTEALNNNTMAQLYNIPVLSIVPFLYKVFILPEAYLHEGWRQGFGSYFVSSHYEGSFIDICVKTIIIGLHNIVNGCISIWESGFDFYFFLISIGNNFIANLKSLFSDILFYIIDVKEILIFLDTCPWWHRIIILLNTQDYNIDTVKLWINLSVVLSIIWLISLIGYGYIILKSIIGSGIKKKDVPLAWGLYFQDGASPSFEGIVDLHNRIMFYLVVILFGVTWIMITIMWNFNKFSNTLVYRYLNHGKDVPIQSRFKFNNILIIVFKRTYTTLPNKGVNVSVSSNSVKLYENAFTMRKLILKENKGKSGIYMFTNKLTNDKYIGQSIDLTKKFMHYFNISYLRSKSSFRISRALLKYGYSNLIFL